MRAVQITSLAGPEAVSVGEVDAPSGTGKVLIQVKAAGVSFPEVLQSRGQYQTKPALPFVPGAELAGVVVEAPAESMFSPGDRVAALSAVGAFAEQAAVDPRYVFPLPDPVSFETGAAVILNYGTAYFALLRRGRLLAGESVLVHGAAGGIGTAAIQVAKAFGAGRVTAVVSTAAKGEIATAAGADDYVLADGFRDRLAGATFDVVVDPVGGDRFTDSLRLLAEDGRLLVIGFTAGAIPEVRVNRLLLSNTSVVGVGWGPSVLARPDRLRRQWDALAPHLATGALEPIISSVRPMERIVEALLEIDERRATGKVIVTP
ncbi:NADPH:quinone oxidoreductase family protein [Streptomyces sp. H23]|uniref:NADPH:quinone oxidoreductase family protein n=1 Tax=Streptomyces sp. H23 TaxID=2541723 RepID=UPI00106EBA30|nr:NADPH:quinone oxidoreductase family protein [Streptomyces sp. H23]